MPQSLHAELARAAEQEEMSLNNFIASLLASALETPHPRRPAPASPRSASRLVPFALVASAALVLAAGVIAAIVLVLAWQQGW